MHTIIRTSLPAALAATIVAGAIAIPAIAADGDTTEDPTTEDPTPEETGDAPRDHGLRGLGFGHGPVAGELVERLAAELDLDVDTVQDAVDAVRSDLASERLEVAVEDGRLTSDQADRIAAALAEGDREAARAVLDEVRLERLEQRLVERVEAGELTQEEADEVLAAAEAGDWPGPGGRRGHHGHRASGSPIG